MAQDPGFDADRAHRHFAAECFNKAWELIEKQNRTPDEDEELLRVSHASLWHWTQRKDCTTTNLSVGYWQASRIHAILGRVDEARRYGHLCLRHSQQEKPFYLAYAYEALARAEKLAGHADLVARYRTEGTRLAEAVDDVDDRKLLIHDFEMI